MRTLTFLILLFTAVLSAACGSAATDSSPTPTPAPLVPGRPDVGEELFNRPVLGPNNAVGCATCHSLEPDVALVGPSLAGVAETAETAVPDQSAEEYLRRTITHPDEHLTAGYQAGVMYQHYGDDLTDQQIEDLVAFMLTLE